MHITNVQPFHVVVWVREEEEPQLHLFFFFSQRYFFRTCHVLFSSARDSVMMHRNAESILHAAEKNDEKCHQKLLWKILARNQYALFHVFQLLVCGFVGESRHRDELNRQGEEK